jgi:uncharacterized membrane protein YcgQ (UPF0703/DUF1980 family)
MKTKEKILSDLTGIPEYRLLRDDKGEYITKSAALKAMEEYANQFKKGDDVAPDGKDYIFTRQIGFDETEEYFDKELYKSDLDKWNLSQQSKEEDYKKSSIFD